MIAWFLLLVGADLWERVEAGRVEQVSEVASRQQAHRVAVLLEVLRLAPSGALTDQHDAEAARLGLTLQHVDERTLLVGEEGTGSGGMHAIRLGPAPPVVCQAPHPWFDRQTGALVARLFERGTCRLASFASTHRKVADAAHTPDGLFQALTARLPDALDGLVVVQIHGAADASIPDGDAVLSEGSAPVPPAELEGMRTMLAEAMGWRVRTGIDVPDLAARKNLQGRVLAHRARFLHLEISATRRAELMEDPEALARLAAVLAELGAMQ